MERVFQELEQHPTLQIQGVHWAGLINAYGCVKKDLGRAIEVFNSIQAHPSAAISPIPLPDAVTYESLINVLVTHRRADLIAEYIQRLQRSDVRMTAYIVNFMIKGYAASGDLVKAREVFEGLEDPPDGVAAPNNHAPHEGSRPPNYVPVSTPVYREVRLFLKRYCEVNLTCSYSHPPGRRWSGRNSVVEIVIMRLR